MANRRQSRWQWAQVQMYVSHPSIWAFIDNLRKGQVGRDAFLSRLLAGHAAPVKSDMYHHCDERILRLVSSYDTRNQIDYLRGIS